MQILTSTCALTSSNLRMVIKIEIIFEVSATQHSHVSSPQHRIGVKSCIANKMPLLTIQVTPHFTLVRRTTSGRDNPICHYSRFDSDLTLRLGRLCEPPSADPHAWWCGGWGRKTPGYPIGHIRMEALRRAKVASLFRRGPLVGPS